MTLTGGSSMESVDTLNSCKPTGIVKAALDCDKITTNLASGSSLLHSFIQTRRSSTSFDLHWLFTSTMKIGGFSFFFWMSNNAWCITFTFMRSWDLKCTLSRIWFSNSSNVPVVRVRRRTPSVFCNARYTAVDLPIPRGPQTMIVLVAEISVALIRSKISDSKVGIGTYSSFPSWSVAVIKASLNSCCLGRISSPVYWTYNNHAAKKKFQEVLNKLQ